VQQCIKSITAHLSEFPHQFTAFQHLYTHLKCFNRRYDALTSRSCAVTLTRHGPAASAFLYTLMVLSRDNTVCNRSLLKYFKAETVFAELQSLRTSGATLPSSCSLLLTMSLAEIARVGDLLSNCPQVRCPNHFCP
jgi:hypothetical protein